MQQASGQPRGRATACDRCRSQKLRCDRRPEDDKCVRCTRLKALCSTSTSRRKGRPRALSSSATSPPPYQPLWADQNISTGNSSPQIAPATGIYNQDLDLVSTGTHNTGEVSLISLQDEWSVANSARGDSTTLGAQNLGHDLEHPALDLGLLNTQLDLTDWEALLQEHTRGLAQPEYIPSTTAPSTSHGTALRETSRDLLTTDEDPTQDVPPSADWNEEIMELMRLGSTFASTIKFYRCKLKRTDGLQVEQDIEHQRAILRTGIGASELYHRLLCRINSDLKHRAVCQEERLSLEPLTMLAQATSCYFLQARQWIVTMEALQSLFPSTSSAKSTILKILPSTQIEGLSSERLTLKAQMFFYACVQITRSTRRQMEMLQSYLSTSGSARDDLAWPAERVKSLHSQFDQVLDSSYQLSSLLVS